MKRLIALLVLTALVTFLLQGRTVGKTDIGPTANIVWETVCDDAVATVYHAVPWQCNDDVTRTASMREIDPAQAGSLRILAMERTMMAQYGIRYGDTVQISGCGQHRIDLLVDPSTQGGLWKNVTLTYSPG